MLVTGDLLIRFLNVKRLFLSLLLSGDDYYSIGTDNQPKLAEIGEVWGVRRGGRRERKGREEKREEMASKSSDI